MPVACSPPPTADALEMPAAGSTISRLVEFRERLTVLHNSNSVPFRVVASSGGVAEGIVSEGQGYGLLLAGVALASETPGTPGFHAALSFGEELFAGWLAGETVQSAAEQLPKQLHKMSAKIFLHVRHFGRVPFGDCGI